MYVYLSVKHRNLTSTVYIFFQGAFLRDAFDLKCMKKKHLSLSYFFLTVIVSVLILELVVHCMLQLIRVCFMVCVSVCIFEA